MHSNLDQRNHGAAAKPRRQAQAKILAAHGDERVGGNDYHLHWQDIRWVTIPATNEGEVLPGLPVNVMPPNRPQVLAVSPSAPLVPGKRICLRLRRGSEIVARFVRETPNRLYIASLAGTELPPVHKSTLAYAHAVVGVYEPEPAGWQA